MADNAEKGEKGELRYLFWKKYTTNKTNSSVRLN